MVVKGPQSAGQPASSSTIHPSSAAHSVLSFAQRRSKLIMGPPSASSSIQALPTSCIAVHRGSQPSPRSFGAAAHRQRRGGRRCSSAQDMVAIVGGITFLPSCCPARISGVSQLGISRRSGASSRVEGKNALQFQLGKDWVGGGSAQGGSLIRSSSPTTTSVSEEEYATVEPGLLARLSKLYRPAVILPGLGNNSSDYDVLATSLEALAVATTVVKVARIDWLRNAAGLLDGNYWKGKLRPRPVLDWYLNRLKIAIENAKASSPSEDGKVSLIGHSAGGWLARVYMAEFGTEDIALLLTLGTPHLPPPRGLPGVFDQSRGLLYYVEEKCPGAYHAPDVKYVCVAGRYLKGGGKTLENLPSPVVTSGAGTLNPVALTSKENAVEEALPNIVSAYDSKEAEKLVSDVIVTEARPESVKGAQSTFRERLVGAGYKQVCGRSNVWGDGVVPEESAHLEGAINIVLDGAYHSPVGADDLARPWYGSAGIIDRWVHHLLE